MSLLLGAVWYEQANIVKYKPSLAQFCSATWLLGIMAKAKTLIISKTHTSSYMNNKLEYEYEQTPNTVS